MLSSLQQSEGRLSNEIVLVTAERNHDQALLLQGIRTPGCSCCRSLPHNILLVVWFLLALYKPTKHNNELETPFWGGGLGGGLGGVRSIRVRKLVSPAKVEGLMSHWFVALPSGP